MWFILDINKIKEKVLNAIDEKKGEIINLCSDIIRIPSDNPPGYTTKLAGFIREKLEEKNFRVDVYEPKKDMPNLVSQLSGSREKPNLVMNPHMDTFPAGDLRLWDFPPYCGDVKEGKILGRGAGDMKGGLSAQLAVFMLLKDLNIEIPGRLTFCSVSDEETGGKWGMEWLTNNVSEVGTGDACLNSEPSGLDTIWIGEKGVCWLKLKAIGVAGYGGLPMLAENAISKIVKVIPIVETLAEISREAPEDLTKVIQNSKSEAERDWGKGAGKAIDHVTVNVGVIKGGEKINLVPGICEIELDTRLPVGVTPEGLLKELKDRLSDAGITGIECDFIVKGKATYTPPRERLVKLVSENAKTITGAYPTRTLVFGATDTRFLRLKGAPSIMYGPKVHNMGVPNEYITVDDYIKTVKIHALSIIDYLFA